MEPPVPDFEPSAWTFPGWLGPHMLADSRFARAYNALGDDRRALLKSLIARHYALTPPAGTFQTHSTERCGILERSVLRAPAPFALLLLDASIDSPALFLSALLPALCARVPQVLAVRLGPRSALSDALLVSCELAGVESLAALGPVQAQRLLADCAQSSEPGLVLYADSAEIRRILNRPAVRQALDASPLTLVPLRAPRLAGLWRDTSLDFPPEDVALLYGGLPFECRGAAPGNHARTAPDESSWHDFSLAPRDLLLVPPARSGQGRAAVTVSGDCLGLWRWPQLHPNIFVQERQIFSTP